MLAWQTYPTKRESILGVSHDEPIEALSGAATSRTVDERASL